MCYRLRVSCHVAAAPAVVPQAVTARLKQHGTQVTSRINLCTMVRYMCALEYSEASVTSACGLQSV